MVVREDVIVNIRMDTGSVITGLLKTRENLTKLGRAGFSTSKAIETVDNKLKRFNVDTAQASRVMGQFKFEMLGVLFFGMAISRFFKSLLQPSFELAGTFEILNDILGIFFLDSALLVNDALFKMLEVMEQLPPFVSDFAGAIALTGVGLGTMISDFGIFVLGITSLNTAFPNLNKNFKTFSLKWGPLASGIALATFSLNDWGDKSDKAKIGTGLMTAAIGGLLLVLGPGKFTFIGKFLIAIGVMELFLSLLEKIEEKTNVLSRFRGLFPEGTIINPIRPDSPSVSNPNAIANAVGGGVIFNNDISITINSGSDFFGGSGDIAFQNEVRDTFLRLIGEANTSQLNSTTRPG